MKSMGLIAIVIVAACGSSSVSSSGSPTPNATASSSLQSSATATVASVSPQSGEIPNGMYRCPQTGEVASFLAAEKAADSANYAENLQTWNGAKQAGAIAGQVTEYSDNQGDCALIAKSYSNIGSSPFLVSWVVQFKDVGAAAAAYSNSSIPGLDPSSFEGGTSGSATGLGTNSIAASNPSAYAALWQRGLFLVNLFTLNMSPQTGQRIALAMSGRINS